MPHRDQEIALLRSELEMLMAELWISATFNLYFSTTVKIQVRLSSRINEKSSGRKVTST